LGHDAASVVGRRRFSGFSFGEAGEGCPGAAPFGHLSPNKQEDPPAH